MKLYIPEHGVYLWLFRWFQSACTPLEKLGKSDGEERGLDSQVQMEFSANSALCLTAALPRTSRGLKNKNSGSMEALLCPGTAVSQ